MSRLVSLLVPGLLMTMACGEMPSIPSAYATPPPSAVSTDSAAPAPDATDQGSEGSNPFLQRATAAKEMAIEAVKLDGTTEAQEGMKIADPCSRRVPPAESATPEQVGAAAACVVKLELVLKETIRRQDVSNQELIVKRMEGFAQAAMSGAKKRASQVADKKQDDGDEAAEAAADKVGPGCSDNPAPCEKKCRAAKEDSGPYCWAMATIKLFAAKETMDPKDIQLAAEFMQINCNLKFGKSSCESAERTRAMSLRASEHQNKAKDDAFSEATSLGDDIAAQMYIATTASKLGGRAARQVPRMRLVIQERTAQQFCPAKKKAVGLMGVAEFNKRSATHCKDEPPTAGGLSGQVSLPNECRTVLASACT